MTGRHNRIAAATGAAVAACVMTALVVTNGGGLPEQSPPSSSVAAPGSRLRTLAEATEFTEMVTRPLFTPERRPAVPEAAKSVSPPPTTAAVMAPPDPPPASRLVAVVIGPEHRAAVLLLNTGKTSVLLEGEKIGGWMLAGVLPDRAILKSATGDSVLVFQARGRNDAVASFAASEQAAFPGLRRR